MTHEDAGSARAATTPAFYARRGRTAAGWWTVLHPPYTLWHLSYVVIGASLAPSVDFLHLGATLLAFFLAVGVAAHAFDELRGRPLGTALSDRSLRTAGTLGLGGAVALGVLGVQWVGWVLVPFIVAGTGIVLLYNLEAFGGRFHTDFWFAVAWGAFPVLVGYLAQEGRLGVVAVLAAGAAFALSWAQRALSTPARWIRRQVASLDVRVDTYDGRRTTHGKEVLLAPIERALKALVAGVALLACALVSLHVW